MVEAFGFVEVHLLTLFALLLGFVELFEDLLALVEEALAVDTEEVEGRGLVAEGFGVTDGLVRCGIFNLEVTRDILHEGEGKHALLDGGGAMQAPLEGGVEFHQAAFVVRGRDELIDDGFLEPVEMGLLFFGQDEDLAGQIVATSVEAGFAFTGFGLGSAGFLRIGAIGFELFL